MRVDPVSRPCFVYCKALWINARLGSDAEGSHVDRMSQQITSSSVYVSVAVGAARHVSPAVTTDLRLAVVQCLCVSRKPSVGEVWGGGGGPVSHRIQASVCSLCQEQIDRFIEIVVCAS